MKRIFKERDRLLRRTTRIIGTFGAVVAFAAIAFPGVVPSATLWWAVTLICAVIAALHALANSGSVVWAVLVVILASVFVLAVGLSVSDLNPPRSSALGIAGAIVAGSVALTLTARSRSFRLVLALGAVSVVAAGIVSLRAGIPDVVLVTLGGWVAFILTARIVTHGVSRASERVEEVGRAHRAERLASELEAQQRQDARLLHDTVLATLSLLAHSGVGVSPDALREQAAEDARLLRQLRLGNAPLSPPERDLFRSTGDTDPLGTTLESVKQRFERMGLSVKWHGSGQLFLARDALEAFLGALSECLENVRRHAGVTEADVTITDDDTAVRALVTDAGVGFDVHSIDGHRLGFAESVVGRLRAVGGRARLFSSPGSGTTVVLEVPK